MLTGVFTMRRYTNPRLPYLYLPVLLAETTSQGQILLTHLGSGRPGLDLQHCGLKYIRTLRQWCQNSYSLYFKQSVTVPTIFLTNNSRTLQDPKTFFHDSVIAQQLMLNHRQTAVTYSVYTVWQYNPSQNVHHKWQRNCLVSTQQEYFIHLITHGVLYIKGMLVKLNRR